MRAPCRTILQAIGLFLLMAGLRAQSVLEDRYLIASWQTEQGLPQNSVTSIAQTNDGFLWFGTFNGLVRFDGVRCVTFDTSNTPQLRSSRIVQVLADRKGRLWIVSEFNDLAMYENGQFSEPSFARDGRRWTWVHQTLTGDIYMQTPERVFYRLNDTTLEQILSLTSEDTGRAVAVAMGKGNRLYISLKKRFGELVNSSFDVIEEGASGITPEALTASRTGGVWAARREKEVRLIVDGTVTGSYPLPVASALPHGLFEDSQRQLWLGTLANGVFILSDGQWRSLSITNGLSHNSIRTIFEDSEGNIWVGTDGGGVNRLRTKMFKTIGKEEGLPGDVVLSVVADPQDRVWAGINVNTPARIENGKVIPFGYPGMVDATSSLWSMTLDPDGSVWTTELDGGLFKMQTNHIDHFRNARSNRVYARSIFRSRDGSMYIGHSLGLIRYRDGQFEELSRQFGLQDDDVRAMAEDSAGRLYLATNGRGLARWNGDGFEFLGQAQGLSDLRVWCLYIDPEDTVWLGTFGGGMSRMKNDRFTSVSGLGGLPVKVVTTIIPDDLGNVWVAAMQGLFMIQASDLSRFAEDKSVPLVYKQFDRSDGLRTLEFNGGFQSGSCKLSDGTLVFSTIKGLVFVNPAHIKPNRVPVKIILEEALVEDQPQSLAGRTEVRAPPGSERLEFRYTALCYSAPEKIRFKFILEGHDKSWVDAGARRSAYYSKVRPGHYKLKILACNNDGLWTETPTVLPVIVEPFFWQTPWFIMISVLLVSGGTIWAVRYASLRRLRLLLHELELKHAFEQERTRIAQDIHDDLGARLTQIHLLCERARRAKTPEDTQSNVSRIRSCAGELMRAIDEIVWAVDPSKDMLDKMADYVTAFTQEFFQGSGIACRLELPNYLPAVPLSADVRHNIFLVLKEALNNVIKHSEATEVTVKMDFLDEQLTIEIRDNGRGFQKNGGGSRAGGGNGLLNMEKRIEKLHGVAIIQTAPGEGTVVRLLVRLPTEPLSTGREPGSNGNHRSHH